MANDTIPTADRKTDFFVPKIVLVDDSKAFQAMFRATFADSDYELHLCQNGQEALALIKGKYIDFICSSLHLKDMDGIELCRRIRTLTQHVYKPFILLTSDDLSSQMKLALPAGVTDVFSKNDIQDLLAFIRRFHFWNTRVEGRVLYVEDARAEREFVATLLRRQGLEVEDYGRGDEAWQAFKTRDFDIVITDVVLDGSLSGISLVNRVRRVPGPKGDVPIVALTGFDDKTRRMQLFSLGVTDYILKPVIKEELIVRLSTLIERKRLNDALHHEREQAQRANKAKSEFLASMSHELRTPLNGILGFGQLLEMDEALDNEQKEYIRHILQAGQHLLELINEILDLAKIEAGKVDLKLEALPLGEVLAECLGLVEPTAAKHGIRVLAGEVDGKRVQADRLRLKQSLLNLLSNAIKYNRPEGEVRLAVASARPGWLRITVTDTGHGIAADKLATLFQPFNRLDAEHSEIEGTGLGLTITREIVHKMGGEIGVESEVGVGTRFWIELPLSEGQAPV